MIDEIRVLDRVLADPDEVRRAALSQPFEPFERQGNYPGARSAPLDPEASAGMRAMLGGLLGQEIAYWPGEENTAFQLCLEGARTWVHHDMTQWAAVLFLTPPEVYRPAAARHGQRHGIGFYRRLEDRGGRGEDSDWIHDGGDGCPDHNRDCGDESDWESVIEVEGLYNRLVAFRAGYYHRSLLPGFGTGPEDGRLTQVFFWNVRGGEPGAAPTRVCVCTRALESDVGRPRHGRAVERLERAQPSDSSAPRVLLDTLKDEYRELIPRSSPSGCVAAPWVGRSSAPRVLLTVLTHHDLPRLGRALESVRRQWRPHALTVEPVVVVNSLDREHELQAVLLARRYGLRAVATHSNGLPGRGKNACLDLLLESECDWLCQLDGDDWLYPSWAHSVADHLRRLPGVDAIGLVPIDALGVSEGYTWAPARGVSAGVWGTSTVFPFDAPGPGVSPLWEEDGSTVAADMVRLVSRAAAARWRFSEDLAIGEDTLMSLCLLSSHQQGDLSYWLSMASDWMVVDRTTPSSIQKTHCHQECVAALRDAASSVIDPARSSSAELPVVYPPLALSVEEKRRWIDRTWRPPVNTLLA